MHHGLPDFVRKVNFCKISRYIGKQLTFGKYIMLLVLKVETMIAQDKSTKNKVARLILPATCYKLITNAVF